MLNPDSFDRVTDRLVEILRDAPELNEQLPERVEVFKGPRRVPLGGQSVHVGRVGTGDWDYWTGGQGSDYSLDYWVACVTRHLGEPEELERRISVLAANVVRVLLGHMGEDGYWTTLQVIDSKANQMRTEREQTLEVEIIPLRIMLSTMTGG